MNRNNLVQVSCLLKEIGSQNFAFFSWAALIGSPPFCHLPAGYSVSQHNGLEVTRVHVRVRGKVEVVKSSFALLPHWNLLQALPLSCNRLMGHRFGRHTARVPILPVPLTLFNILVPRFSYLLNVLHNSTCLVRSFRVELFSSEWSICP